MLALNILSKSPWIILFIKAPNKKGEFANMFTLIEMVFVIILEMFLRCMEFRDIFKL